jgi:hypothetical protein
MEAALIIRQANQREFWLLNENVLVVNNHKGI